MIVNRTDLGRRRTANFNQQGGDALDVFNRGREIDATLEAMTGIGRKIEATGTALYRLRPPECGFQIDILRFQRDSSSVAAHDAGQRFDLLVIGDHTDPLVDADGIAVQQFERFACLAPADIEAAVDLVEVEHVRWTAQLQHHIVGNIDQGRDRTLTAALQALLHPMRRRSLGVQTTDHATGETAAQIRRRNLDRQGFSDGRSHNLEHRLLQRGTGQRRYFTGYTQHRQAISLVRRQLDGELEVVQFVIITEILTDGRIVRQLEQAALVFRQFQFTR